MANRLRLNTWPLKIGSLTVTRGNTKLLKIYLLPMKKEVMNIWIKAAKGKIFKALRVIL